MSAHLLDGNVLVALVMPEHVHHESANAWIRSVDSFSTCPTVQGTLLRMLVRQGTDIARAREALGVVVANRRHEQWTDDLTYLEVDLSRVYGHRQVTDAYLAQLARARRGRIATFDRGLVAAAPDVADLVPR
ncbi:MAG: TA system VapC family ribonuclease toxin [Dermatophilaceae bacterium]